MNKKLVIFIFSLVSFQAIAENCPDCPRYKGMTHAYWNTKKREGGCGWGEFHCDQIRKLRIRIEELGSNLNQQKNYLIECDTTLENSVVDREQNLWKEINSLKKMVQSQSETIKNQSKRINYLENIIFD